MVGTGRKNREVEKHVPLRVPQTERGRSEVLVLVGIPVQRKGPSRLLSIGRAIREGGQDQIGHGRKKMEVVREEKVNCPTPLHSVPTTITPPRRNGTF